MCGSFYLWVCTKSLRLCNYLKTIKFLPIVTKCCVQGPMEKWGTWGYLLQSVAFTVGVGLIVQI